MGCAWMFCSLIAAFMHSGRLIGTDGNEAKWKMRYPSDLGRIWTEDPEVCHQQVCTTHTYGQAWIMVTACIMSS